MQSDISQAELARVRDWASRQAADGRGPPWSNFLLKRLGETIDALIAGMDASRIEASPPAAAAPCQSVPRLVVSNNPRDHSRSAASRPRASEHFLSSGKLKPPVPEPVA
jgi:hypothetical protein